LEQLATAMSILDMIDSGDLVLQHALQNERRMRNIVMKLHYCKAAISTETCNWDTALHHFDNQRELFLAMHSTEPVNSSLNSQKDIAIAKHWASILGGIANSHQGLGNHVEAEEYYDRALAFYDNQAGEEAIWIYGGNLCRTWMSLGKLDKASKKIAELLSAREARFGTNDESDWP
jgi:tetratricopeptide (TPR) repeat protein